MENNSDMEIEKLMVVINKIVDELNSQKQIWANLLEQIQNEEKTDAVDTKYKIEKINFVKPSVE